MIKIYYKENKIKLIKFIIINFIYISEGFKLNIWEWFYVKYPYSKGTGKSPGFISDTVYVGFENYL